jgi:hypothetical protein
MKIELTKDQATCLEQTLIEACRRSRNLVSVGPCFSDILANQYELLLTVQNALKEAN